MANSSKGYLTSPTFRFLPTHTITNSSTININMASDSAIEFHESDFFYNNSGSDRNNPEQYASNNSSSSRSELARSGSSVPVNIPDWSKILGVKQYLEKRRKESEDVDIKDWTRECEEGSRWVPPHEFLANTRMASSSVHEGVGRTLKGRDLRSLRNAIWAKTGFQD